MSQNVADKEERPEVKLVDDGPSTGHHGISSQSEGHGPSGDANAGGGGLGEVPPHYTPMTLDFSEVPFLSVTQGCILVAHWSVLVTSRNTYHNAQLISVLRKG